jgi:hypothetical protein
MSEEILGEKGERYLDRLKIRVTASQESLD